MQTKAKTLIERHGFLDLDRKNSKHDEIQIWAYHNFHSILHDLLPGKGVEKLNRDAPILEYPIKPNELLRESQIVGFIDIFSPSYSIAMEVKVEIPVIGDLIRQIQFYKHYINSSIWIVISPDDRAKEVLNDSGILFFKYGTNPQNRGIAQLALQL